MSELIGSWKEVMSKSEYNTYKEADVRRIYTSGAEKEFNGCVDRVKEG